jgi:hypothetical protein
VHEVDDRIRAPGREDLTMLTCGLLAVKGFLDGYPSRVLDDGDARRHEVELAVSGLPGAVRVCASTFVFPAG